ncbi:TadE/TadG family type IV pilus assembly protein [Solicola sp. PLA-1-18]|uniref:TadE/TadG family type IV pilus assembly protein n=1 Tax=Solicola sp. PLA-1-18 TaxID=3380532 RepID=UPI003B81122D
MTTSLWRRLRHGRAERGTTAIEFAFIAPLLLLCIFAIVWFGLYFYGRNVALTSAREGVSYLRLAGTNADPEAFQTEARRVSIFYARNVGVLKGAQARSEIDEDTGLVTMTVTGYIDVPGRRADVTQTVTATLEQFRGDPGVPDVP